MTVYIITAVHNRYDITKRFVSELKKQTYKDFRFVLVNDGCTDQTVPMVKKELPDSVILEGKGNLWWGGALHKAYQYLMKAGLKDEDIIFYANDDSRWAPDFIEIAVEILKVNPNSLLTGCAYGLLSGNYLDGPVDFNLNNGAVKLLSEGSSSNCASTRSLCLFYKVFKELGGFHPVLLPHYASDYEYTIRAAKKGHMIISDSRLKYQFSEDTTGDNSHKEITLKKVLSKRSKLNPFYKLSFILLIAPFYKIPAYFVYQVKHFRKHERDTGNSL
ncbi:glycosyltransferase family 2 protein [Mediterraneibacter faecis]|uniref:glycosyltransferase family 2 protein n=1 Tax=Mediterraneibacter faecis TaxID=592978 RepID=UPI003F8A8F7F